MAKPDRHNRKGQKPLRPRIVKGDALGRPPFLHRLPKPANDNRLNFQGLSQFTRLVISSVLIIGLVTAIIL